MKRKRIFHPNHYTPPPQHTLVTEIRELIYPEDRPRFDEIVYRRYTTGNKAMSTTAVPTTSTSSRIDHYDTRHVSGKIFLNYQFSFISSPQFFTLLCSVFFILPLKTSKLLLYFIRFNINCACDDYLGSRLFHGMQWKRKEFLLQNHYFSFD